MSPREPDRRHLRRRWGHERGSAAIELAMLVPAVTMIMLLAVAGGRVAMAHGSVQQAAADAARAASITRTAAAAQANARTAAAASLANQGLQCTSVSVAVDTAGFAVPIGRPASVSATVSCNVRLGDLAVPSLPGERLVTATVVSPLDTYRGRK